MRPGDFSPGNLEDADDLSPHLPASMRPGDFSPGNVGLRPVLHGMSGEASMRPGDFSPGNVWIAAADSTPAAPTLQ